MKTNKKIPAPILARQTYLLQESELRGFSRGTIFTSANGVRGCLVSGVIVKSSVQNGGLFDEEVDGDVVSTEYGLIYDHKEDRWGVPSGLVQISGIRGKNAMLVKKR